MTYLSLILSQTWSIYNGLLPRNFFFNMSYYDQMAAQCRGRLELLDPRDADFIAKVTLNQIFFNARPHEFEGMFRETLVITLPIIQQRYPREQHAQIIASMRNATFALWHLVATQRMNPRTLAKTSFL